MLTRRLLPLFIVLLLIPYFSYGSANLAFEKEKVLSRTTMISIPFIQNQGQADSEIEFYANTFAGNVMATGNGEIVYSLVRNENNKGQNDFAQSTVKSKVAILKESFIGSGGTTIKGEERSDSKINYYIGNKENWKTGISSYQSITFGEIYNDIELRLKAYGRNVEKLFIINPGGRVSDIKVKLEGASGLEINKSGELEICTLPGSLKFTTPYAYQEINGNRNEVDVEFKIASENKSQQLDFVYGFEVGAYNKNYPLVIDPLLASTFIGGWDYDSGNSIKIDKDGSVFVAGYTYSSNYPVVSGSFDTSLNGSYDVFVSKLNNDLSSMLSSSFIGGSSYDYGNSLTIDSTGNVFVTGYTSSANFPLASKVYGSPYYYSSFSGYYDVFVLKLNNDLSSLLASRYLGGTSADYGNSIAVDSEDNVFVTGYTSSSNFPVASQVYSNGYYNIYDSSYNGSYDVFVSKLDNSLDSLIASTFIGGSSDDSAYSAAIDSGGSVIVTGNTYSSGYPVTSGSYDTSYNGSSDVFVSKLSNDLSGILASTFIGGSNNDYGRSLDVDSDGNILVTGNTYGYSYYSNLYPTTSGAYDTIHNGYYDVFVSKLSGNLDSLLASTFIGGYDYDVGNSLDIDSSGNVFITGYTYGYSSNTNNYPATSSAFDAIHNGYYDVFVSKLSSNLNSLLASTFIGGGDNDRGNSLAIDSSGNVFITGYSYGYSSSSNNYPATSGAFDTTHNGYYDAFISKLDDSLSSSGTIKVTTNVSIASFTLNGPVAISGSGSDWSTSSGIVPGTYTITYNDVLGYVKPPSETKTLVLGGTITFSGTYSPKPGSIAVSTNVSSATFTITGPSIYYGSGTYWATSGATAGKYTITYGDVAGYETPSSKTKTLISDEKITFTGSYIPSPGKIIVSTNLPAATFKLDGPEHFSGSGISWEHSAEAGKYTITYSNVDGYVTPPTETKTLTTSGVLNFSGSYNPLPGIIVVSTNVRAASFTIDGASDYSGSGTSWSTSDALPGAYTITYGDVAGYTTPPPETLSVESGGHITFSGAYESIRGSLSVSTNLAAATFKIIGPYYYEGSGISWSISGANPGTYKITYGSVAGYVSPPAEVKILPSDGSVNFTATYTPISYLDISARKIKCTTTVTRGKSYAIRGTVKNIGDDDVYSFTASFYLSTNNDKSVEGDTLLGEEYFSWLEQDESDAAGINWKVLSSLTPGNYYIKVFFDSGNSINEYRESNNIGVSKKIQVK